jgi:hypothetical protein
MSTAIRLLKETVAVRTKSSSSLPTKVVPHILTNSERFKEQFVEVKLHEMDLGRRTHLNVIVRLVLLIAILVGNATVQSQTVYVTKTGTKYHRSSCRYLNKSKISKPLDKALGAGYIACSVCKPAGTARANTTVQPVQSQTQTKSVNSVQCRANTKSGNQCSRMTKESNGRCWQHQ